MQGYKVYLDDILRSIEKIEKYTEKIRSYSEFSKRELIADGVIRNLEIIGEAIKNLPEELKKKHPEIEWKKIAGLRDILTHAYFGIDLNIIWDLVKNKLPILKESIKEILEQTK